MQSTSINLLEQLRSPEAESAWSRFVDLYGPMIYYWGRNHGLDPSDAADLVQDVLGDLVVKLQSFQYDPQRRFRGWLRTIVLNRAHNLSNRNRLHPQTGYDSSFFSAIEGEDFLSESDYRGQLAKRTLLLLRGEVGEKVWQAAWMQIVEGIEASKVAQQLRISRNAAYLAKSRVLARLRQQLNGLLEFD